MSDSDRVFKGSVPADYERWLVPMIFEPYAQDLCARVGAEPVSAVLEIAAGTGVVTRALAAELPPRASIVATDLNQAMLDEAERRGAARPVEWRQADAMSLPFPDESFDAVVCQFGVMFFPDKPKAFAEAHRVLAPGGRLLFNVWDRIEDNEFADVVIAALAQVFRHESPRFLARTPHGYFDRTAILRDLKLGGFEQAASMETVTARSPAESARAAAVAYCQGTPLRGEIEAHGADALAHATEAATAAIEARFGAGAIDGRIQALVITARKP